MWWGLHIDPWGSPDKNGNRYLRKHLPSPLWAPLLNASRKDLFSRLCPEGNKQKDERDRTAALCFECDMRDLVRLTLGFARFSQRSPPFLRLLWFFFFFFPRSFVDRIWKCVWMQWLTPSQGPATPPAKCRGEVSSVPGMKCFHWFVVFWPGSWRFDCGAKKLAHVFFPAFSTVNCADGRLFVYMPQRLVNVCIAMR